MGLNMLKNLVKKGVSWSPELDRLLGTLYRRTKLIKTLLQSKFIGFLRDNSIPDPETSYWISPDRIIYHTNYMMGKEKLPFKDRVFHPIKDKGKVYRGDWDKSTFQFTDLDIYKALEMRIKYGTNWEDTGYYMNMLREIKSGRVHWGCYSQKDLDGRCHYLDLLIESIRERGYQPNYMIKLQGEDNKLISKNQKISEEIAVNIGRHGQYLFQDGRHRLAIAKILGVKDVLVKVHVRHKEWVKFRRFLLLMANSSGGGSKSGSLYQPAIHPDLSDITASHGCEDRFLAIKKHLDQESGILLDVGANLGYFCHRFEDVGYECYAVENIPEIAKAAECLRSAEGKKFQIIEGDLFEVIEEIPLRNMKFDVVLVLNILHHFLKTKENYYRLRCWLNKLAVKEMFFEPHQYDEPQMNGAFVNYQEQEFVDFILANTQLKNASVIFGCEDGRNLYKLST